MTVDDKTYLETKRRKFGSSEVGVIQPRLIDIDIDHIIPDELHLLLRVTDKMIENLINAAIAYDHNVNNVPQSKVLEGPMLKNLIKEIHTCGVTFIMFPFLLTTNQISLVQIRRSCSNFCLQNSRIVNHRNSVTK